MMLVVFLFTHIFNKGIDRYPAYYFAGFLIYEFFLTAIYTSVTTLRDNKDLIIKSLLPREMFVLSRVITAFVNLILGCIPFLVVLAIYRANITWYSLLIILDFLFLLMFTTGISYVVSIIYVFARDTKDVVLQTLNILRYFVAMFYSIDWVSLGVQSFIKHNPPYVFIKIARDLLIYGVPSEKFYWNQMIIYGIVSFVFGRYIFEKYKDNVLVRL